MPFVKVCSVNDIKPGQAREFGINGKAIAVFNADGEFYCLAAHCSHAGGPLALGDLDGYEIQCPWHAARFDIRNGRHLCPPAPGPVRSYPVKVDGESVMVDI